MTSVEPATLRISDERSAESRAVRAAYTGDDDESCDRHTDGNRSFHYLVAKASGNDELAETLGWLHDRLARIMVLHRAGATQMVTHKRIVDASEALDAEGALQALLDEIDHSRDSILDNAVQEEADSWRVG